MVSGLAALLLEARPGLKPDQVKALLKAGAVDLAEDVAADGAGRVDLARTLALETPSAAAAAQPFRPAVLDLHALWRGPARRGAGRVGARGDGRERLDRPPLVRAPLVRAELVRQELVRAPLVWERLEWVEDGS